MMAWQWCDQWRSDGDRQRQSNGTKRLKSFFDLALDILIRCYTMLDIRGAMSRPGNNNKGLIMENFNIEALPVTIEYAGEVRSKWRDGDTVDAWRVTINGKNGFWSTDYFTGIGLRTKPKQQWATPRPNKPSIADVLNCLFMDAEAGDYNFSDWCNEFGYSDDSINALNTYRQCLETATHLRKYFTPEQRDQIRTIIQDM